MKKQCSGIFINTKTGERICNPYVFVRTNESGYIKTTKSVLSRIIYDLSGNNLSVKMLAILINNIKEPNNHIRFGLNRLIDYFSSFNEKSVISAFNKLKMMHFFVEISKSELIFNPSYIFFRNSEHYGKVLYEFNNTVYYASKSKGKPIDDIGDLKPIPYFDNTVVKSRHFKETDIFDYHFAKVKDDFIVALYSLGIKRLIVFATILLEVRNDDKSIIISKLSIPANKETISAAVKKLLELRVLLSAVRGVYCINSNYISASSPYQRKMQAGRIGKLTEN